MPHCQHIKPAHTHTHARDCAWCGGLSRAVNVVLQFFLDPVGIKAVLQTCFGHGTEPLAMTTRCVGSSEMYVDESGSRCVFFSSFLFQNTFDSTPVLRFVCETLQQSGFIMCLGAE